MISQAQIKELSRKLKANESIVAREFVQISFLKELYETKFSKNVFFKGGTAIRLLYGGKRFSEDLDFTVQMEESKFLNNIQKLFQSLENQYPYAFKQKKTLAGKTYLLTATLPSLKSDVFVKLDFSMRENVVEPVKNILETEYPVIVQCFIQSLSKDELLAEKIRAVLKREKHRDIYDLWILQELGGKINVKLIGEKLKYYNETFDGQVLLSRLDLFSKENFIKDLRPFVPTNEREKLGELFEYVKTYLHDKFGRLV